MGYRPTDGRGKPAGKRQYGDRASRRKAEDAAERGKGRVVEGGGSGNAEQRPDREISGGMRGIDEERETERGKERADGHDPMPAVPVDQPTDAGRHETRREQRERKPAHGKAHRPATRM